MPREARSWRPWTPARHFLAYLTVTLVLLLAAIAATPQVGGSHHLFMVWPLLVIVIFDCMW